MKSLHLYLILMLSIAFWGCSTDAMEELNGISETPEENPQAAMAYFPPVNSNAWETVALGDLGWDVSGEEELYDFLEDSNTEAFIVLKDGRIVIEKYFGNVTADTDRPWFSVGKSLTAFVLGIALQDGHLSLDDSSQNYLGEGWSSLNREQEQNISIKNHITMTTGLDYTVENLNCTDAECLPFLNEAGSFWYYHTGAYTLTQDIIASAVGENFKAYFDKKLKNTIGMDGNWFSFNFNSVYRSNARSMARFGLLVLNGGRWNDEAILGEKAYLDAMTNTSQEQNEAYGYLWWLNGKDQYRLPGTTSEFSGSLIPNAPDDLIAGLGANDQKLYVVSSENLVIVRLGGAADSSTLGPSGFDDELWEKLNALMGS